MAVVGATVLTFSEKQTSSIYISPYDQVPDGFVLAPPAHDMTADQIANRPTVRLQHHFTMGLRCDHAKTFRRNKRGADGTRRGPHQGHHGNRRHCIENDGTLVLTSMCDQLVERCESPPPPPFLPSTVFLVEPLSWALQCDV